MTVTILLILLLILIYYFSKSTLTGKRVDINNKMSIPLPTPPKSFGTTLYGATGTPNYRATVTGTQLTLPLTNNMTMAEIENMCRKAAWDNIRTNKLQNNPMTLTFNNYAEVLDAQGKRTNWVSYGCQLRNGIITPANAMTAVTNGVPGVYSNIIYYQ